MTCWIETDSHGRECIFCDSAAVGADVRRQALNADTVLIRASDGHVFTAPLGLSGLSRLSHADVEMVEHWLRERDMPSPNIFAGDPVG
jgi:hypothetical protein